MPIGQRPEAGYLPISASGRLFCAAVMATTVMVAWLPGGRGWRRCGGRGRSRDAPAAEPARGLPRLLRGGVPRRGRPVRGPGRFAGAGSEAWTQAAAYCRGRRDRRETGEHVVPERFVPFVGASAPATRAPTARARTRHVARPSPPRRGHAHSGPVEVALVPARRVQTRPAVQAPARTGVASAPQGAPATPVASTAQSTPAAQAESGPRAQSEFGFER